MTKHMITAQLKKADSDISCGVIVVILLNYACFQKEVAQQAWFEPQRYFSKVFLNLIFYLLSLLWLFFILCYCYYYHQIYFSLITIIIIIFIIIIIIIIIIILLLLLLNSCVIHVFVNA